MRTLLLLAAACFALNGQGSIGPGTYKGTWTGSQAGGDFHLTVRNPTTAEVGFTIEGQEIPGKILSMKIDGASIAVVYEFDLQGNKLQSSMQGTLKGKALEGTYKTTAADTPVDEGTWKTTAQ
jgi:hypothetical protein